MNAEISGVQKSRVISAWSRLLHYVGYLLNPGSVLQFYSRCSSVFHGLSPYPLRHVQNSGRSHPSFFQWSLLSLRCRKAHKASASNIRGSADAAFTLCASSFHLCHHRGTKTETDTTPYHDSVTNSSIFLAEKNMVHPNPLGRSHHQSSHGCTFRRHYLPLTSRQG